MILPADSPGSRVHRWRIHSGRHLGCKTGLFMVGKHPISPKWETETVLPLLGAGMVVGAFDSPALVREPSQFDSPMGSCWAGTSVKY